MSTTHEAGWAHASGHCAARPGCARPATRRPGAPPVVADGSQGGRRVSTSGPVGVRAGRERQHAGVRPRRGRLPRPRGAFRDAFAGYDVFYAGKAFLCTTVAGGCRRRAQPRRVLGRRADRRPACRVRPARIGYHGNNKTVTEARRAVAAGIGRIVLDSFDEIDRLAMVTAETGTTARVMVRVTAGVEAHTHEYIATAHEDQKFGFSITSGDALEAGAPGAGRARDRPARAALPSAARSSTPPALRWLPAGCSRSRRGSRPSSASCCRRWTSAAASASPTPRRTTRLIPRSWPPR